jgi:hypothetical protein
VGAVQRPARRKQRPCGGAGTPVNRPTPPPPPAPPAVQFFLKSGLHQETLGQIWEYASGGGASLNSFQFQTALRLVALAQVGGAVPQPGQLLQLHAGRQQQAGQQAPRSMPCCAPAPHLRAHQRDASPLTALAGWRAPTPSCCSREGGELQLHGSAHPGRRPAVQPPTGCAVAVLLAGQQWHAAPGPGARGGHGGR